MPLMEHRPKELDTQRILITDSDELGCLTRWRIVLVVQAQKGPAGTG
jgi:hypothetical protein